MERRRQRRAEARRDQILANAIQLFARHGYHATAVSDVAAAAGVSHGTVFLHFGSKEALFRAAVLDPLAKFRDETVQALTGSDSSAAGLRDLVTVHLEGIRQSAPALRLLNMALLDAADGRLGEEVAAMLDEVGRALARAIAKGQRAGALSAGDPDVMATSYLAFLNGVGLTVTRRDRPLWRGLTAQGQTLLGIKGCE